MTENELKNRLEKITERYDWLMGNVNISMADMRDTVVPARDFASKWKNEKAIFEKEYFYIMLRANQYYEALGEVK